MESSSNTALPSKWCNLPSDILLLIAEKLDENHLHQVGAVCTWWKSCLALCRTKTCSNFPLEIPCPIIPTLAYQENVRSLSKRFRFWVVQRSVLLISPLKKEAESSPAAWIVRVEQSGQKKWTLLNALNGMRISPTCCNMVQDRTQLSLNLLDFCITEITEAYTILWVDMEGSYHTHSCNSTELSNYLCIRKVITFRVDEEGIIILLALYVDGKLASWKSGCHEWKMVDSLQPHESKFVDIICFDGKFCAVDLQGSLIIIDPQTLKPIKMVAKSYDNVFDHVATYLVQCEEYLYLVKQVNIVVEHDHGWCYVEAMYICFVLTEKGWVANRGFEQKSLRESIFFLGTDVTYSLSAKYLGWPRGNFIYQGRLISLSKCMSYEFDLYMNMGSRESSCYGIFREDYGQFSRIYDYNDGSFVNYEYRRHHPFVGSEIFWPPPKWVRPDRQS